MADLGHFPFILSTRRTSSQRIFNMWVVICVVYTSNTDDLHKFCRHPYFNRILHCTVVFVISRKSPLRINRIPVPWESTECGLGYFVGELTCLSLRTHCQRTVTHPDLTWTSRPPINTCSFLPVAQVQLGQNCPSHHLGNHRPRSCLAPNETLIFRMLVWSYHGGQIRNINKI